MKKSINQLLLYLLLINFSYAFSQSQLSIEEPLSTRQVHLDFHTSEYIPEIGAKFDKKQFQEALKVGKVNHINIFSKGHHGYSYYPTKVGTSHPELKFDLLGSQLEACKEIGVKCPLYFAVGWSVLDAEQNPDWVMKDIDGSMLTANLDVNAKPDEIRPNYSWKCLDPTPGGGYHEFIMKNVKEICERYNDLDGFWFDIYHIKPFSLTTYSKERMISEGVDLNDKKAMEKSFALALKAHMKDLRNLVSEYHPKATVFFNSATHIANKSIFKEALYEMNTHAELEDLPTTWGGYDKLPLEAKFHLGKGTPIVAMSGKFHKAWGEFGGFKHPDAIKYEAAAMISFGASCNFGDQLHPSGMMDMETYKNIGKAYDYVEKIEGYGPGGTPVSNLGVWLSLKHEADQGVVNMLLQLHQDFVVADVDNLNNLEMLMLPSHRNLSTNESETIQKWVNNGGKLIVFGKGAMLTNKDIFGIDLGVNYESESPFDFDFTVLKNALEEDVVKTPFVNYDAAIRVNLSNGIPLAMIREPYFNRTYEKYSSHRETPYLLEDSKYPAIVQNGNTIFFSHSIDQLYFNHGMRIHRQLFGNAINRLNPKHMIKVDNLPSSGRISFLDQKNEDRYVLHLLYSSPILRADKVQVIEDFIPISGAEVEINLDKKIKKIYQIPSMNPVDFKVLNGIIKLEVPEFLMHTGIVLEY